MLHSYHGAVLPKPHSATASFSTQHPGHCCTPLQFLQADTLFPLHDTQHTVHHSNKGTIDNHVGETQVCELGLSQVNKELRSPNYIPVSLPKQPRYPELLFGKTAGKWTGRRPQDRGHPGEALWRERPRSPTVIDLSAEMLLPPLGGPTPPTLPSSHHGGTAHASLGAVCAGVPASSSSSSLSIYMK